MRIGPRHRPGPAARDRRRARRAAAGRLGLDAADRRAHVLPHRHRGLDGVVARRPRRPWRARSCATTSCVADVVERHGGRCLEVDGRGRLPPCRCSPPRPTPSPPRSSCSDDSAERPSRSACAPALHTGEAAAARRRLLRRRAQRRRARPWPGRRRARVPVGGRPPRSSDGALPDGAALVDLGPHRLRRPADERCTLFAFAHRASSPRRRRRPAPTPACRPSSATTPIASSGATTSSPTSSGALRSASFVAVVGASGSGKSSVLRAGVVPVWGDADVTTPGARPAPVVDGPDLVVVDQLEEAFTLCDDDDRRRAFLDSLVARTGPVAVGLRADFYGRFAEHQGLGASRCRATRCCSGPWTTTSCGRRSRARRHVAGLHVDPALVDVLVDEVQRRARRAPAAVARAAGDVGAPRRTDAHLRRLSVDRRRARRHRHHRRAGARRARRRGPAAGAPHVPGADRARTTARRRHPPPGDDGRADAGRWRRRASPVCSTRWREPGSSPCRRTRSRSPTRH